MRRSSNVSGRRGSWVARGAVVATLAALAVGCKSPLRPRVEPAKFTTQAEAGTGHVAVLSVADWDDVRGDLQPTFDITAAQALVEAGPTTAAVERKLLDMLKVVASVATPSTSTTIQRKANSKSVTDATGKVTDTSERSRDVTEDEKPGEAREAKTTLPGDLAASKLPGLEAVLGEKPVLGPVAHTQYALAAALFQEVKLLDHYVEYAAVRGGYRPSVARLQVSLMPSVRNGAYDAYTTLGFFPSDDVIATQGVDQGGRSRALPIVVPLLVTDDMEAALTADSADVIRQYALALSAMIRGFSLSADVERYTDELVTTVTRDFNSLYQVARLTDNSIRVRMGARLHSSGNYFMVPQTHNVTLLVLTPQEWRDDATVLVEAKTEFRDVATGIPLDSRHRNSTLGQYRELLDLFGFDARRTSDASVRDLADPAGVNDYPTFRRCVERLWQYRKKPDEGGACVACDATPGVDGSYAERTARRMWIAFANVAVGGQYTSTAFTLPPRCPCSLPGGGPAYGIDDGASTLVVELRGVHNVVAPRIGARLRLSPPGDAKDADGKPWREISIPATDVAFDRDAETLACRFPSLARVRQQGASALARLDAGWSANLEIQDRNAACDGCAHRGCPATYGVSIASVAKEPSDDASVEVTALPALRSCACGAIEKLNVRISRTAATSAKAGKPAVGVVLALKFMRADGKTPASGAIKDAAPVTKDAAPLTKDAAPATNDAALTTTVDPTLNRVVVTLPERADDVDVVLSLTQLEDDSTLTLAAKAKGSPAPPGTATVRVSVSGKTCDACAGKGGDTPKDGDAAMK